MLNLKYKATILLKNFVGRIDFFAQQGQKGFYYPVSKELNTSVIIDHLLAKNTIGTYPIVPGSHGQYFTKFGCLDFDSMDLNRFQNLWDVASSALPIESLVPEFSGRRGFHIWIILSELIAAWKIKRLLEHLIKKAGEHGCEVFPKQSKLKPGGVGNLIKLPCGIHRLSGKRSQFIDPHNIKFWETNFLSIEDLDLAPLSEDQIDKALFNLGIPNTPEIKSFKKSRIGSNKYAKPSIKPIYQHCEWVRHCFIDSRILPEPEWYAILSILGCCENGNELAHHWSKKYPGYSYEETQKKLKQAITTAGPRTCENIRSSFGAEHYCRDCKISRFIKSPISIGHIYMDPADKIRNRNSEVTSK